MANIFMGNATIIILSGMETLWMLCNFAGKSFLCMCRDVRELCVMVWYSMGKTNIAFYKEFSL